jgi:hypothetical protein
LDEELVEDPFTREEDVGGPLVVNGELLGDVLLFETPFELVEAVEVEGTPVFDWE